MSPSPASRAVAALVALLAFSVFATSLPNGLPAEDLSTVSDDAASDPLARTIFLGPAWSGGGDAQAYRPLTTWTLAVEHAFHGQSPLGYHLGNVLLHAGAAALVVLL